MRTHLKKHIRDFEFCPICKDKVQDVLDVEEVVDRHLREVNRLRGVHNKAVARRLRDQVSRDLGLTKVKGSLGGTYWE